MRLRRKWGEKIMQAVSMALGIDPPNDDALLYRGDDHLVRDERGCADALER